MRTTIDGSGRIVVPKALRDLLGIHAGQALDVRVRAGRLEVEAATTPLHLHEDRPTALRAVSDDHLRPLTVEEVRRALQPTAR